MHYGSCSFSIVPLDLLDYRHVWSGRLTTIGVAVLRTTTQWNDTVFGRQISIWGRKGTWMPAAYHGVLFLDILRYIIPVSCGRSVICRPKKSMWARTRGQRHKGEGQRYRNDKAPDEVGEGCQRDHN
jgi:hypothetical protein